MVYDFAAEALGEGFIEHVLYYMRCLRTGHVEEDGICLLFGETRVSSGDLRVGEFTLHAFCRSRRLGDVIRRRLEVHPIERQDAGLIVQPH